MNSHRDLGTVQRFYTPHLNETAGKALDFPCLLYGQYSVLLYILARTN